MGGLSPLQLRAVESLCDYLDGQEGGGKTLDEIFQTARDFEDARRQIFKVADLMQELDAIPPEKDFPGRKEARSMLASLSIQLKKVLRVAARRPGKLRGF